VRKAEIKKALAEAREFVKGKLWFQPNVQLTKARISNLKKKLDKVESIELYFTQDTIHSKCKAHKITRCQACSAKVWDRYELLTGDK